MKTETTHQVMIEILANLVALNQNQKDFQKSLENNIRLADDILILNPNEQARIN